MRTPAAIDSPSHSGDTAPQDQQHFAAAFPQRNSRTGQMRKVIIVAIFAFISEMSQSLFAANGSWNSPTSDVWSNSARWLSNIIADGAGSTGNFTFNITATTTITIDGAVASRTLGIMNIGDSTGGPSNYVIAASGGGTLTFDNTGSNAQLNQTSTSGNNTISAPVILNGSLDIANASANNLTFTGGITAGTSGSKTITASTGTITVNSVIGNGNGTVALVQNGPGTVVLQQVNTYSGNTTITGGSISIDGDATLGDGTGTLFLSGGTLVATATRASDPIGNNISVTANSAITTSSTASSVVVNVTGTVTGTGGTLTFQNTGADASTDTFVPRLSGGTFTMSRPIIVTGTLGTVQLTDFNASGTSHTFDGAISGSGSFARSVSSGAGGTTVFNGVNTYTGGTSVSAGTLLVNSDNSGATGVVTVNNSGTLGGTGTIGGATTIGATVNGITATITGGTRGTGGSVVSGNIGTLTLSSSLTFSGVNSTTLGTYFVDIGSGVNNSDKLTIGGALDLTNAFDQILFNGTPDGTSSYVLAVATGGISGTFNVGTAPSGYMFSYSTNELDLVPVPEPNTWGAAALAAAVVGYSFSVKRRKRFQKRGS